MIYFSRISDTRNLSHCFFFLKPLLIWRTLLPFWSYFFFFFALITFFLYRELLFFFSPYLFLFIFLFIQRTLGGHSKRNTEKEYFQPKLFMIEIILKIQGSSQIIYFFILFYFRVIQIKKYTLAPPFFLKKKKLSSMCCLYYNPTKFSKIAKLISIFSLLLKFGLKWNTLSFYIQLRKKFHEIFLAYVAYFMQIQDHYQSFFLEDTVFVVIFFFFKKKIFGQRKLFIFLSFRCQLKQLGHKHKFNISKKKLHVACRQTCEVYFYVNKDKKKKTKKKEKKDKI